MMLARLGIRGIAIIRPVLRYFRFHCALRGFCPALAGASGVHETRSVGGKIAGTEMFGFAVDGGVGLVR
jgi:hypothetical protein